MISSNYIPEKISEYNAYLDGSKMIGVAASVTLPEINMKTSTVSGVGVNGELDSPTIGQFESMEQEIQFNTLYSSAMDMLSPLSTVNLTLRAAQQVYDKTGGYNFKGLRVVEIGRVKSFNPGKVEKGEAMEATITLELTYIMIEVDGVQLLEVDKLNGIYKVNGNDMLAGVDVKATAAIAASMQAMGVSTDRVGTSIKRIYTNITKGSTATAAQEAAFERLGFSATQIAKSMQADGTGTLLKVFEAVNNQPDAEKLSTLNALFGQWAIEGGAKLTQNLGLLTGMLKEVSNASVWSGSMEKEFIIKATTPEAIETMLGSAKSALMDDIGTAFLPAYKEFGLSMIGFIRGVRENMPELTKLAESLGKLASRGVEKLGTAMNWALPYIQKGLDYLLNNGEQVAHIIGILAATFAGMKLAPAAEGLLSGVGGMLFGGNAAGGGKRSGGLFGGIKNLFMGGRKAGSAGAGFALSLIHI